MSRPPRDIAEWMRFMEQEVKKAARSGQSTLARELQAEIVKVRDDLGAVDTRQPAAPIEFTIQTSVLANPRPYSQLTVNFSDVAVATDATAITVEKYELWGRDETAWNGSGTAPPYKLLETSATSDFFSEPYAPGAKWRIKARAIGEAMRMPGVWSAEFLVTMVADTLAPKLLPNPDLSQTLGVVAVKWDGLAADNTAMDPDFRYVEIAMGAASAPTALLPDTFTSAGAIYVPDLPYGQPRYFRMRAVDWSGNKSGWSGDSSITRQPLVSGDISGLDVTIQEQTERAEDAEAAAVQAAATAATAQQNAAASATAAQTSASNATTAANEAQAAQAAADQVAADAALVQAAADQAAADAAAAEAAAAQSAAEAAAATTAAQQAAADAQTAQQQLEAQLGEGGRIIYGDTTPAAEDQTVNNIWLKSDGSMWRWDEGGQAWTLVEDEALAALGIQVDAAKDAAEAAEANAATSASEAAASEQAALAAQAEADTAAATAATAQGNAQAAQTAASNSASAANTAQAQAEAAQQAAAASQAAALAAQNEAEQAAIDAGSSSAAALAAENAAEAANLAADAAVDAVESYIRGGDTMIVNGNFDAPITSPPLGWPTRTLTYNEASTTTARSGTQVLRATPTTATIAYAYTDYVAAYTGQILYIEYHVRLREALKSGNSAQQLGAYVSALNSAGSSTVYSAFQNNGAAAVTLSQLSTTTWTKVAVTQTLSPADITQVRVGPRIPAVTTGGQNFEIDDFRVVDITQAKAALDAANAAQSSATAANNAAGAAQSTATTALNAANGNAKLLFSIDPPSGTAPYGTVWFQTDGNGAVIGQWQQSAAGTAGTWSKRDIRSETIANLDVGKLVGGFIDASHIQTETLTVGAGTLGDKLATHDAAAVTVSDWDDGNGNIAGTAVVGTISATVPAAQVSGTLAATAIPNLSATKITSGTFSGVVVPTGVLSGTISNSQVASGIDPSKLTGTGTVPTAAVPSLDAAKITTGTLPTTVAVPTATLSGTVSNAQVASGIDPSKLTGTGTVPTAAVPALDAAKITTGTLPTAVTVPASTVSGTVASATTAGSATTATNATNVTGTIGAAVTVPGGQVSGAIPVAAVPALDAAKITTGTLPTAVAVPGASVTGTVPVAAVPSIPATKVTSGTFSGVTVPTTLLSGTVSNSQVASGIDPNKLTGTGTVPTAAVPALDAAKITTGTLPGTVAVPTTNLSGTVSNSQVASGIDPSKLTGTGTVPTAAVPALPTSKITNLDTSLTANATAATTAQQMASYSANPSFEDWTATWPASYDSYSSVIPTKDTTKFKVGTQSVNFVTDATTSAGLGLTTLLSGSAFPDLTYYTVEVGFMLNSGGLNGAEVLIDWTGYTNYRAGVRLDQAVPTPVLGKWYRVVATIARPTTGGGTWTAMGGYLMANHNSLGATHTAKNINFDWFNVRPATDEEIKAYLAKQKVDSWASPSDVTYIDGGKLYTDSVKALQIDTNDLSADTGFVGSMRTVILTADTINTTMLAAGAITSKHTITGATVQTEATAARGVKMISTGILGYDGIGTQMFTLSASTGRVNSIGRVSTGASGEVGAAMIPAEDSYNGKVAAFYFTRDGSFPGGNTGGMWCEDASVNTPMNVNLRGHYGGHVEIITGHLYVRGSGTRVGNFSNWALGNSTTNGTNYLPNLMIQAASGTGYLRLVGAPTSSSAANGIIATSPEGVFYRSTSSLRYKADVQDWTPGSRVLDLRPRSWVDRIPMDKADPFQRYFGAIAEEVYEILPEVVTLNEFNEPESIQYDRISVAMVPILKNVIQRLETLEGA